VHSNVFLLDAEDHIVSVTCQGPVMQIKTAPNFELVIPKNTTLVGSAQWKCPDETGRIGVPLYRGLVSLSAPVKSGSNYIYTAQTTFAGVADCFEDGSFLNFSTAAMNNPFSGNKSSIAAAVKKNFGYNYDESSGKAKENIPLWSLGAAKLDCTDCWFDFELGLSVGVSFGRKDIIIPYLKSFHAGISGTAKHNAQVDLTADAAKTASGSKVLTTIPLPGFTFFLGFVPVYISLSVPISVGYDLSASAAVSFSSGYDLEGSVGLGIEYDGGKWQPTSSRNFGTHFHEPTFAKKAGATAEVYLEASIDMEFYAVGGGQFNLKPDVSSAVTFPGGCSGTEIHIGTNWGVTGNVDAILTKPIHATSPAFTVFDYTQNLANKCM